MTMAALIGGIRADRRIARIAGAVPFDEKADLIFRKGEFLEGHSNAVRLRAEMADGAVIEREYHSIGGGAIVAVGEEPARRGHNIVQPYPFSSAAEMLAQGEETELSIGEIVLRSETAWRPRGQSESLLDRIANAMMASIERGMREENAARGGGGGSSPRPPKFSRRSISLASGRM